VRIGKARLNVHTLLTIATDQRWFLTECFVCCGFIFVSLSVTFVSHNQQMSTLICMAMAMHFVVQLSPDLLYGMVVVGKEIVDWFMMDDTFCNFNINVQHIYKSWNWFYNWRYLLCIMERVRNLCSCGLQGGASSNIEWIGVPKTLIIWFSSQKKFYFFSQ